jgi:hypothetical protein
LLGAAGKDAKAVSPGKEGSFTPLVIKSIKHLTRNYTIPVSARHLEQYVHEYMDQNPKLFLENQKSCYIIFGGDGKDIWLIPKPTPAESSNRTPSSKTASKSSHNKKSHSRRRSRSPSRRN